LIVCCESFCCRYQTQVSIPKLRAMFSDLEPIVSERFRCGDWRKRQIGIYGMNLAPQRIDQ
jgi:hypothetical protein